MSIASFIELELPIILLPGIFTLPTTKTLTNFGFKLLLKARLFLLFNTDDLETLIISPSYILIFCVLSPFIKESSKFTKEYFLPLLLRYFGF